MRLNEIDDKDSVNADKDMDNLLAVLHGIPQASIPEEFEERLHQALKEEGRKIRGEKKRILPANGKRYIKAVATVAACFLVVFASVSVYNGNKDDSIQNQSLKDCASANESVGDESLPERASDEPQLESESLKPENYENYERLKPESQNPADKIMAAGSSEDSEVNLFSSNAACDGVKEENVNEEIESYLELMEERLSGCEYKLLDCVFDEETGDYHFTIHVIYDPQGENTGRQLMFTGRLGEMYEEQREESQINSD